MPSTPLAGLPYPSGSAAPAAAADLMALAMAIDSGGLLTAIDAADRDARYTAAPAGTVVTSSESKSVWMKLEDDVANWLTLFEATAVWTPLTLASGLRARAGWYTPAVRVSGNRVQLRGAVETTGGSDIPSGTVIATLAIGKPAATVSLPIAGYFQAGITDVPARRLDVATTGQLTATGHNDGPWISLDGCEWEIV